MMGSNDKLFYALNVYDIVPQDHLLRDIDRVLDLSELREHLAPYYSHPGRPSLVPELMIRMLLNGHCCGIRLERQLCYVLRSDDEPGVPLALQAQDHRPGTAPLDVLEEPGCPVPGVLSDPLRTRADVEAPPGPRPNSVRAVKSRNQQPWRWPSLRQVGAQLPRRL